MRISDWSSDVCSSDLVAVAEAGYAAVLQKPADDALDPDVVRQAADARPQAADAADHEIDLHAGLGRAVQPVDDLVIDQGIQLHPDMPGTPLGGTDRTSVLLGKIVSARVTHSVLHIIKKKT